MINDQGDVLGLSYANNRLGRQAWIYNGSVTRQIGLSDNQHMNAGGYPVHEILELNNHGQAIGTATRYHDAEGNLLVARGLSLQSTSAWFFDGQKTVRLGYTDAAHTTRAGIQSSTPVAILDSGLVAGHSSQYFRIEGCDSCNDFPTGRTAWVYQHGVTRKVGFPELRDWYGTGHSEIQQVSSNGWVAGITRYKGGGEWDNPLAWLDDGTRTIAVEIPQPKFSEGDVVRSDKNVVGFTAQGALLINSNFFADPLEPQTIATAWEYQDGQLRELGLFDASHRLSDGGGRSQVTQILDGNVIVGVSERYNAGQKVSDTLWADYGSGAIPLEIITEDDDYSRLLYSDLVGSNAAGQLAGNTIYLTEGDQYVARPWFYDPTTGLVPIDLPESTRMRMRGLTAAGWLYGSLTPLDHESYGLSKAFIWHSSTGLLLLSELLANDLLIDVRLDQIVQGIDGAIFAGQGTSANGTFAFMAIAVPEPSSFMLFAIALTTLSRKRRLAA